ncbi:hypothetical protein QE429_004819 [Bacillus sp. SORGH_AS 510]|nr:hypothetical protein [Bacillus sp. SORGH_AS_0510]
MRLLPKGEVVFFCAFYYLNSLFRQKFKKWTKAVSQLIHS